MAIVERKESRSGAGGGLTVDQLLNVARAQGGAVAEVAEELSNPKRSILSTVGNGFKNAFTGFLETISVPGQVVAGVISDKYTVGEAIKENISVSDVVFGDEERRNLSGAQKVGSFTARLAVDVLTDPLTYVTFGASSGVFGVRAASKFFLGKAGSFSEEAFTASVKATAKKEGKSISENEIKRLVSLEKSKVIDENVIRETLKRNDSLMSEEDINKFIQKSKDLGVTNAEMSGRAIALSDRGTGLSDKYLKAQREGTRHTADVSTRKLAVDQLEKTGVKLADITEEMISAQKAKIGKKFDDKLMNQTLNARLSKSFVVATVGRIIQKNPALIETLVDKGGIKFFGKSILSGQRIKNTSAMIPGITALDRMTKAPRDAFMSLFDQYHTLDGKLQDELIAVTKQKRDLADSAVTQFKDQVGKIYKSLGITENEARFISASIENGIRPADRNGSVVWDLANDIMPDADVIRPEVWQAAGFTKAQLKYNRRRLLAAGVQVSDHPNYFPHMTVKQEVKQMNFQLPPSQNTARTKFAKISTLVDDTGKRISVAFDSNIDRLGKVTARVAGEGGEITEKTYKATRIGTDGLSSQFVEETTGKAFTRARATIPEAKQFGVDFEENALTVLLMSSMDAIKTSVSRDFVKEVAQKFGTSASTAPSFYRAVKVTGLKEEGRDISSFLVGKSGEEILFHPMVAEHIEKFAGSLAADDATQEFLKQYDKLQNVFKASVTAIWPAFHGRNAISNVMLNFLDIGYHALNPVKHAAAGNAAMNEAKLGKLHTKMYAADEAVASKARKEYSELMAKPMFKDKTGYEWSFGELRNVIKNNVVAFNPRNLGQIDQVQFSKDTVAEVTENLYGGTRKAKFNKVNPFSTKNLAIETGLKVGSLVEDQARLVNFFANLEKTGDPLLAAERTKMFLFDYQNLSNFERNVLRRIIPFYTFSRKNIELQTKTLFTRPGAIAGEIRAVQTIGDALGGGDLSEEERAALPEWMRGGINTVLSREGSHITLLGTIGSPVEQPFQQLQSNQALASVSPIIRLPIELMSNYSAFHGKAISEVTNAAAFKDAPGFLKDAIGFTEVNGETKDGEKFTYYASLRPKMMHTIQNLPPSSRVWSTIKNIQREDVSGSVKFWQHLIGFNPHEFDLEVEASRREKEMRDELQNVLDTANVGFTINRFILNKED